MIARRCVMWGQLALVQELKPATVKAKAKPKVKANAAAAKAVAAKASAAPVDECEGLYSMRRHKRKLKDGFVSAFAVFNIREKKQLVQLTSLASKDAEAIVQQKIEELNSGKTTAEDVVSCLNKLKSGDAQWLCVKSCGWKRNLSGDNGGFDFIESKSF